jgi:hypothetical protein
MMNRPRIRTYIKMIYFNVNNNLRSVSKLCTVSEIDDCLLLINFFIVFCKLPDKNIIDHLLPFSSKLRN